MHRTVRNAALALVAGTATAHGAILQWDALFSGNASTANNWNPNQVPTAADDLLFDSVLNNNYTVTYDALVPTARSHLYRGDNVRLRATNAAGHTVSTTFSIENGSSVIIEAGTFSVGTTASVGTASASAGSLNVDHATFAPLVVRAGPIGPGEIVVTNGGRINATTIEVSGPGSMTTEDNSVITASTVRVGGSASPSVSTASIAGESSLSTQTIDLAPVASSSAVFSVQSDVTNSPTILNAGSILIANNSSNLSAGTATFECRTGAGLSGPLVDCGTVIVGDANGGDGTLRISSGRFECGTARFTLGHSTLVIGGLGFTCRQSFEWLNGDLALEFGTFQNALCSLEGTVSMPAALRIAPTSSGAVELRSTDASMTVPGITQIGGAAAASGSLRMMVGASATFLQTCTVGQAGSGSLTLESDSDASFADLRLAASPGSTGTLSLDASSASVTAGLFVGGTSSTSGGSATASILNGSLLTVSGASRVWGNGHLRLAGGSALLSNSLISTMPGAQIELTDSTLRALSLLLSGTSSAASDGADILASGTVDAAISATGFGNNIVATGDLVIGKATSPVGFNGANLALDAGAHAVTLGSTSPAVVSTTTIAGGSLLAPSGLSILVGGAISGGGSIDAPAIVNSGTINSTTPQGLVLKGIVSGAGSLTGTLFDFSNTGGFTGTGTIHSQIRGTAGSIITSTGALSLGTASSVGFSYDGTLRTGANTITLHDTSIAAVGNIELAGGTLFCTDTDLSSDLNDVTSGFGTIGVSPRTWITAGVIRPGGSGADTTGQIGVAGNVNADNALNTSVFDMEIGGTAAANMDRFVVLGALTIDGTLRVRFVPGYVPFGGELFTIITANSVAGNFTSLDLPPRTRVIVNPTNVQVEALCVADFNEDGSVDGDDVIGNFAAWDNGLIEADTNGDGSVDGDDVIFFFDHWDSGC